MSARNEFVWTPPADARETTRLGAFLDWLRDTRGLDFETYHDLWRWSVDDLDAFWLASSEWSGVRWHDRPTAALATRAMPGAEWFPGGTLNYAEHALGTAEVRPGDVAVIAHSQTRAPRELTWAELADSVARCRAGLVRLGVERGDRVVAYLPNVPETLIAFLATASLGAVWSSCAPEFGVRSVVDRFAQIEPTVLFAIDGYHYGDHLVDKRDDVLAIEAALPTLQHTVHLDYAGLGSDEWTALLEEPGPLEFVSVPFAHPLYVLASSGTTGLPKAIVHGHGGITVEHLKTAALHHDLRPGDRFFWFTTTGWMMWNYLVSGLMVGATIVLFDGNPASPDLATLWQLASDVGVDVFGVSASFLMACRKAGVVPPPHHFRSVASTGSPLPAEGFRWVRDVVGREVQPASVSGGTDVCAAFVGAVPLLPVRAGEITGRWLGCAVEAFDPEGRTCAPGQRGELVITEPMPSMPVGFWNDPTGEKLRAAYFDQFPGVWRHGDWITFTDDGACVISGRSDATLNRRGVRLGTSDFYAIVEDLPEIADSLVVDLESRDPEVSQGLLVLFVVVAPGGRLDELLRGAVIHRLRTELSPRHAPDLIVEAPAVPRTLSGKKLEVPVKRILLGEAPDDVASRASLADPGALDWYEEYGAGLRRWFPSPQV